jgi:hypothetical protein
MDEIRLYPKLSDLIRVKLSLFFLFGSGSAGLGLFDTCPCNATVPRVAQT